MVKQYNIVIKTNLDVLQINKALSDITKQANIEHKEFRVESILKIEGENEVDSD